jgi:hypothetical protein
MATNSPMARTIQMRRKIGGRSGEPWWQPPSTIREWGAGFISMLWLMTSAYVEE